MIVIAIPEFFVSLNLQKKKGVIMSTMNLNAEFFHHLSLIADDENYMKKAVNYIKHLVEEKEQARVAMQKDERASKTKAEMVADINEMCTQIKQARIGKLKGRPAEELFNEL